MTFRPISRLILRLPDLWGTVGGKPIGLYDPVIRYHAANEPILLLDQREVAAVTTSYPDTYTMTFSLGEHDEGVKLLTKEGARLAVNDLVFTIDHIQVDMDGATLHYEATGWPRQTAQTIPQNLTSFFPGWDDVGHEYLDQYDYPDYSD